MEPLRVGGTKVPSESQSHDRDAVKTLKIFSRTKQPLILKLVMQHRLLEYYKILSNNDHRLTFDLCMQRSVLVPCAFVC